MWVVGFDGITIVDQVSNPENTSLTNEEIKSNQNAFKKKLFRKQLKKRDRLMVSKTEEGIEKKTTPLLTDTPPPPPGGDDDQKPPMPDDDRGPPPDDKGPPGDDDKGPPGPPGDDDTFDDSKHPSDDDENIPWDDDNLSIYDIYDPFTFVVAN